MYRMLAIFLAFVSSTVLGAERTVWQIGKPDHRLRRVRLSRATTGRMPGSSADKPVVFEVGRSDPARDWPFIQPGPIDVWSPAGGKAVDHSLHAAGAAAREFTGSASSLADMQTAVRRRAMW